MDSEFEHIKRLIIGMQKYIDSVNPYNYIRLMKNKLNELNNENESENTNKISALNEFEIQLQNNINNYETVTKNILKCIDSAQLKIFSSQTTK